MFFSSLFHVFIYDASIYYFNYLASVSHRIVLEPGQSLRGQDEPAFPGSALHEANVADGQPALADDLQDRQGGEFKTGAMTINAGIERLLKEPRKANQKSESAERLCSESRGRWKTCSAIGKRE